MRRENHPPAPNAAHAASVLPGGVIWTPRPAGPGTRLVAAGFDHLLLLGIVAATMPVLFAIAPGAASLAPRIGLLAYATYFIAFELFAGRTPGKASLGLRVMREDGAPLRIRDLLVRNLLRMSYALLWPLLIDGLAVFVTQKGQRVGDVLAATLVVREGHPRLARSVLLRVPFREAPTVAEEALERIHLTPDELLIIRTFCFRTRTMKPRSRRRLARQFLEPLYARAGLPCPSVLDGEDLFVDLLHHANGTFRTLARGILVPDMETPPAPPTDETTA